MCAMCLKALRDQACVHGKDIDIILFILSIIRLEGSQDCGHRCVLS